MEKRCWTRREKILFTAALFCVFLFLIAVRSLSQNSDSYWELWFAARLPFKDSFLHTRRFLFSPLLRGAYLAISHFMPAELLLIYICQIHNTLWLVASMAFAFLLLAPASSAAAFLTVMGLFIFRGFVYYTLQCDSYIPAIGCFFAILWILGRGENRPLSRKELGWIAFLYFLSSGYHLTMALLLLPLGAAVWTRLERRRNRILTKFLFVAGGAVFLWNAGCVMALRWEPKHLWNAGCVMALRRASRYLFSMLWTQSTLSSPGWGTWRNVNPEGLSRLTTVLLTDIQRTADPASLSIARGFFWALWIGLVAWNIRQVRNRSRLRAVRVLCLAWFLLHLAFFLWWLPDDDGYMTLVLAPLLILAGLAAGDLKPLVRDARLRAAAVLAGFALLSWLFYSNLTNETLPNHFSPQDLRQRVAEMAQAVPSDSLVLTSLQTRLVFELYNNLSGPRVMDLPEFKRNSVDKEALVIERPLFVDYFELFCVSPSPYCVKEKPAEIRFLLWFFDARKTEGGLSMRGFRAIDVKGQDFVLLSGKEDRVTFAGLKEFCEAVDGRFAAITGRNDDFAKIWLERVSRPPREPIDQAC